MINRVGSTFVHRLLGDDRRARRTRSCAPTCSAARSSASVPLWLADRGARQQGRRRSAVGDADRHEPADRPRHHVVPALAPACRRHGRDDRAFHAAGRGAGGAPAAAARRRRARAGRCRRSARYDARRRAGATLAERVVTFDTLYCDARHRRGRGSATQAGRARGRRSTSTSRPDSACRGCATRSPRLPGDQHWQMLAQGRDAGRSVGLQRTIAAEGNGRRRCQRRPHCSSVPGRIATGAASSVRCSF